ncbi:response regulator [Actinoplanes subtropicus]|uniref:response regulator n=1 Tax=Actinoplanes subtropicus TaxID=543632 RepID=UPI0004C2CD47|nr:response regulator transcription factor [Actinoplanes subtropicus]
MSGRVRVLLVDDHPVFRAGLSALLDGHPDVEVVGEAADGAAAVELAARLRPDVLLMDVQMPGGSGIEATGRVVEASPGTAVLVLTMFGEDASVFAAMRAGARGYLLKDADGEEVLQAVRVVAAGGAVFGTALAQRLTAYFATTAAPAGQSFPELTTGERQVLDLIAAGHPNAEIAARLGLSPKTVRNRVSSIFAKLRVRDRAEAIVRGRDAGLGRAGG